jgi:ABC-type uncharacterized transport system ATPase subunit
MKKDNLESQFTSKNNDNKKDDLENDLYISWLERAEYKWVFKIKKEQAKFAIKRIMEDYEVEDISIEDENISETIEKIYKAKEV